jgi:hypothetical protein
VSGTVGCGDQVFDPQTEEFVTGIAEKPYGDVVGLDNAPVTVHDDDRV